MGTPRSSPRKEQQHLSPPPPAAAAADSLPLSPEDEALQRIFDLFADQYHDIVHELPLEYHRTFLLLTDLERAHQAGLARLRDALRALVADARPGLGHGARLDGDADRPEDGEDGDALGTRRRTLLERVAREGRDTVRSAEEKVGLAVALYEAVDRQIQSLDASLLRTEDSLVIGLRPGTLPSHDAPAFAPKSPPGRTTSWGARAVEGDVEMRVRGSRRKQNRDDDDDDGWMDAVDPNEPTYCFCERVSFGEMIGCENDDCAREWFHLSCVNLTEPPEGTWYCSECVALLGLASDAKDKKGKKRASEDGGRDRDRDKDRKKKKGNRW